MKNFLFLLALISIGNGAEQLQINCPEKDCSSHLQVLKGSAQFMPSGIAMSRESQFQVRKAASQAWHNGKINFSVKPKRRMPSFLLMGPENERLLTFAIQLGRLIIKVEDQKTLLLRLSEDYNTVSDTIITRKLDSGLKNTLSAGGFLNGEIELLDHKFLLRWNGKEEISIVVSDAKLNTITVMAPVEPVLLGHFSVLTLTRPDVALLRAENGLEVAAFFHNRSDTTRSKHHIVSSFDGPSRTEGLFTSPVSAGKLDSAAQVLGWQSGNNLTEKTWTERNNNDSKDAKLRVKGQNVSVSVIFAGQTFSLDSIFQQELDFHYVSNKTIREQWHSGCLLCYFSCPGGIFANARITAYEFFHHEDKDSYIKLSKLPFLVGDPVTLRFTKK